MRSHADRETLASTPQAIEDIYEVDEMIDASLYAIYKFHLFEADDPRVESTMKAVEEKLWVKTRVGGVGGTRTTTTTASATTSPACRATRGSIDRFIPAGARSSRWAEPAPSVGRP